MKFRITMKDPDGPYECLQDAAKKMVQDLPGLHEDERESIVDIRYKSLRDFAMEWLEYGEYIEIEFDTESGTATLIPVKR